MATGQVTIEDAVGLHARPAARFVETAKQYESKITVSYGENTANAKSLVKLLTLEARQGAVIDITAEGADAEDAVDALTGLLSGGADDRSDDGAEPAGSG